MGVVVSACVPPRCASVGNADAEVDMGLLPVVGSRGALVDDTAKDMSYPVPPDLVEQTVGFRGPTRPSPLGAPPISSTPTPA